MCLAWIKNHHEEIGAILSFLTLLVAVITAKIAYNITIKQLKSSKESTAKNIFQNYLNLCIQNPSFTNPEKNDLTKEYRKYECFIWNMMNACEEIHTLFPKDKIWRQALIEHLKIHKTYLKTNNYTMNEKCYGNEFNKLVAEAIQ
jgi:hypothetical protein